MPTDNKQILAKIISIQAWARGLEKETTRLRKMMEGEVSTSPKIEINEIIIAKRNHHIFKKQK